MSRPPGEVERILRRRAETLAKPLEEVQTPTELLDLLVLGLSGERYGIETFHVLEVVPLREVTPVPGTPPFVLGVVNHRGRILSLLDLRRLLDLPDQGVAETGRVVVVEAGGRAFGIFAEDIVGTVRLGGHELAPPAVTLVGERPAFIRGLTGAMVTVLDLEAFARDARITVNEEVG